MTAAHRQWIADRDHLTWSPFGTASLAATHWLTPHEQEFDDVDGRWSTDGEAAVGTASAAGLRLAQGEKVRVGGRMLGGFARDGAVALRVWDPEAPRRRGISAIERAAFDPSWSATGLFTATAVGASTEAVDGHRAETVYDGAVTFEHDGTPLTLLVRQLDDCGLFAPLADATSGTASYPFRFLRLERPDADGRVVVDLNRAHLPPCAFSDHYVCVFPPPENRLPVAVTAGELRVV